MAPIFYQISMPKTSRKWNRKWVPKVMKNDENWSQNGSQNEVGFEIRGVPGPPFSMKKGTPKKESQMRAPREPRGSPNGAKWTHNGAQMAPRINPMVIGLISGRKWTSKCPALLLLAPLGPQTSPCASIRPPLFPSTSCPHRFPLGAAVSRSAYNAFGRHFGTHF